MASSMAAYLDEAPEYEIRDGQMRIKVGGSIFVVMPVAAYIQGMARAEAEIARWQLREMAKRECVVVPIGKRA